jgi:predicted amidohydrolase
MADNVSIVHHIENYFENSLEVDSPQWNRLVSAAVSHQVYISPAFSHRQGDSIYMGQALISPKGEVMHFRHKMRPSGGEREIWSDGTIDGLKVIATPYGRWGVLECWEQFHPVMTFNMQAQAETLHLASFPCKLALLPWISDTDTYFQRHAR